MLDRVRQTIAAHGLLEPDDCVLSACSGGPDSVALTSALAELRRELRIELCVVHLDHGLRPEAKQEGNRVEELAGRLGLPLRREALQVPEGAGGLQERAREVRYARLEAVAATLGCRRIAVGHTRSDQAETVLHRLLRGTGVEGLGAIPVMRGRIVRPLLDVSRPEVLLYLESRGLSYVQDPSNERPEFLRSRIRHELLPLMDGLAPGVEARLAALAGDARDMTEELQHLTAEYARPSVKVLARAPSGLRLLVVRELLRALRGDLRGLCRAHFDAALRLVSLGPVRGEVHLPGGALVREDDEIRWSAGGGHRPEDLGGSSFSRTPS